MRLIKPSFEIETPDIFFEHMEKLIEKAGRTCYKSEKKITDESAETFIRMIIDRGHDSVLEHQGISVRIICDRGVSHEIVRHRLASYSQESTRYCDYKEHMEFIIPVWCDTLIVDTYDVCWDGLYGICHKEFEFSHNDDIWFWNIAVAERDYNKLRKQGWKPEQARSVLPNSLKTEIVMTMNLREWRHFFNLRCSRAAHPQMREIAVPLSTAFYERLPAVFGDLKI
jgi:thymidylate synthase (FAD)